MLGIGESIVLGNTICSYCCILLHKRANTDRMERKKQVKIATLVSWHKKLDTHQNHPNHLQVWGHKNNCDLLLGQERHWRTLTQIKNIVNEERRKWTRWHSGGTTESDIIQEVFYCILWRIPWKKHYIVTTRPRTPFTFHSPIQITFCCGFQFLWGPTHMPLPTKETDSSSNFPKVISWRLSSSGKTYTLQWVPL